MVGPEKTHPEVAMATPGRGPVNGSSAGGEKPGAGGKGLGLNPLSLLSKTCLVVSAYQPMSGSATRRSWGKLAEP